MWNNLSNRQVMLNYGKNAKYLPSSSLDHTWEFLTSTILDGHIRRHVPYFSGDVVRSNLNVLWRSTYQMRIWHKMSPSCLSWPGQSQPRAMVSLLLYQVEWQDDWWQRYGWILGQIRQQKEAKLLYANHVSQSNIKNLPSDIQFTFCWVI